jgi:alpha,alpha-trehalose phosphorylase
MRLSFGLGFRGRQLRVEVNQKQATYTLRAGEPIDVRHYDEQLSVSADAPQKRRIPRLVAREAPRQPKGRAPVRRQRDR